MKCGECGQTNVEHAGSCTWCGAPLVPEAGPNFIPHRNLRQLVSHTFSLYRKNFWSFILIGLPIQILGVAALFLLPELTSGTVGGFTPDVAPENSINLARIMIPLGLLMGLFTLVTQGATTLVVRTQYLGHEINVLASYRRAISKAWILIIAGFLGVLVLSIPMFLGTLLLIVSGLFGMSVLIVLGIPLMIFFGISFVFMFHLVMIEGTGPVSALRGSYDLVKGSRWRVLGIGITFVLISFGIQILIGAANAIIGNFNQPLATIISVIGQALLAPVMYIGLTVIYFELRARKEGLTLDSLSLELAQPSR